MLKQLMILLYIVSFGAMTAPMMEAQATITIANQCNFAGWHRNENTITFYAQCNNQKKSWALKDDGLLSNFAIKKNIQSIPISIDIHEINVFVPEKIQEAIPQDQPKKALSSIHEVANLMLTDR